MTNLIDKIKKGAKKAAVITSASLLGYAGINSNAQAQNNRYEGKPEKAQKFGTALIGGKEVQVDLSEYVGSSYLSVPSEDEFGHVFYPWDALRSKDGIDSKGEVKDTLEVVHWKARGNYMEDLETDVAYEAQKLDGKYLVHLMNIEEDDVLGLEISESTTTKEGDVITGTLKYESGKIEDVIRTVQFPGEDEKYYLLYRDQSVDSSGVVTGKKTPFVFLKTCEDNKQPLYFSGKDVFLEGEMYEFVATEEADLKKVQDPEGNSVLYSDSYLEDNAGEINEIRMSDRAKQDQLQKKGIPGHVKELLEEGEPCDENGKKNRGDGKFNPLVILEMGYSPISLKGLDGRLSMLMPIKETGLSIGAGLGYSLADKLVGANMTLPGTMEQLNGVNLYLQTDGSIDESKKISPSWNASAILRYLAPSNVFAIKGGLGVVQENLRQIIDSYTDISILDANKSILDQNQVSDQITYDAKDLGLEGFLGVDVLPFRLLGKGPQGLGLGVELYGVKSDLMGSPNLEEMKNVKDYGAIIGRISWMFGENLGQDSKNTKKNKKNK